MRCIVATAGWSIPRACGERFAGEGTHLQRYAAVLRGAEINSSFHRPHASSTYARWASTTPDGFRFAVKLPRAITHDRRLIDVEDLLARFLDETAGLGAKRGPLLIQLPPSFAFDGSIVSSFLELLRARHAGPLACEPRHSTWLSGDADQLLVRHQVARVAADPPRAGADDQPGGWRGLVYYRLHGAPRVYWSPYDDNQIRALADALRAVPSGSETWCVFDNTASGAALANAWELHRLV